MSEQHFISLYFCYCVSLFAVVFEALHTVPYVVSPSSAHMYKLMLFCLWRASTNPNPISLVYMLFSGCCLAVQLKDAGDHILEPTYDSYVGIWQRKQPTEQVTHA